MLRYINVHVFYDVHYKRASTQKLSRASRATCFCFIKWFRTSWVSTYWCCCICVSKTKKHLPSTMACTLLPFLVHAPIEYSCSVVTAPHIQQSGVGSTPGWQLIPQKLGWQLIQDWNQIKGEKRGGWRKDSILTWTALLLAYHTPPSLTNFSPPIHFPLLVTLTLFIVINTPISDHQTEWHHQFALIFADSS